MVHFFYRSLNPSWEGRARALHAPGSIDPARHNPCSGGSVRLRSEATPGQGGPALPVSLLLVLILALPLSARAEGIRFHNTAHFALNPGESLPYELWLVADRMDVAGTAEEAFFGFGGEADLSGVFRKDVWAFTRRINFDGHAHENVRLMGSGPVTVNGAIRSSLMAASGRTLQLDPETRIGRDAVLMAHDVITRGVVGGHVRIMAVRTTLGGDIVGTVRIQAEDIVVLPGTRIGGDLIYTAPRELILDRHVHLDGELIRLELKPGLADLPWAGPLLFQGVLFLAALLVGGPFVALFPGYTGRAVRHVRRSTWKCGLVGAIAFFLIPMLALIALVTLIGIPLGLVMLCGYVFLLYMSKIMVGLALGGALLRRQGPQPFSAVLAAMTIGLLCLYFLASLPMVGDMITIIIGLLGLGGLILGMSGPTSEPAPPENGSMDERRMRDTLSP